MPGIGQQRKDAWVLSPGRRGGDGHGALGTGSCQVSVAAAGREDTGRPRIGRREQEVLRAWFRCDSKSDAARELYLSVNTVKKHIERVRAKYAAVGRPAPTQAMLVIRAIQDGWLDVETW